MFASLLEYFLILDMLGSKVQIAHAMDTDDN